MQSIDKKIVEIKCKGSMTIPLEDIVIIQGDLKTLTEDNYKKLRHTIVTEGYCDPLNLWFDPKINKWCSLDGTQRTFVLKGLKADGYLIPPIPANEIMAKDRKEAMKLILTFSSNYGKLTDDGLSNFCIDAGIDVDFLNTSVVLPEVSLDYFSQEEPTEGLTDPDEAPEVKAEPKSKLGDLFILGNHRLLCGDSTDQATVEKLMNGDNADMVFTDPPYGINEEGDRSKRGGLADGNNLKSFVDDSIDYAVKAFEICDALNIKKHVWWGANYYCHSLPQQNNWLVWDKRVEDQNVNTNSDCELAWVKDGHQSVRIFRHLWKGMVKASEHGDKKVHPTQKPISLAEWCFSKYGDPRSVLDLFGGSGTTLIACEKTNRKCYMMELDPHYIDVIIQRWQAFTGQEAVREDGVKYNDIPQP